MQRIMDPRVEGTVYMYPDIADIPADVRICQAYPPDCPMVACPTTGEIYLHAQTCAMVDDLVSALGHKPQLSSWSRSEEHNDLVAKKHSNGFVNRSSMHLIGAAVDLLPTAQVTPANLLGTALEVGFKNVGLYNNGWVHLDTRTGNSRFWWGGARAQNWWQQNCGVTGREMLNL